MDEVGAANVGTVHIEGHLAEDLARHLVVMQCLGVVKVEGDNVAVAISFLGLDHALHATGVLDDADLLQPLLETGSGALGGVPIYALGPDTRDIRLFAVAKDESTCQNLCRRLLTDDDVLLNTSVDVVCRGVPVRVARSQQEIRATTDVDGVVEVHIDVDDLPGQIEPHRLVRRDTSHRHKRTRLRIELRWGQIVALSSQVIMRLWNRKVGHGYVALTPDAAEIAVESVRACHPNVRVDVAGSDDPSKLQRVRAGA
mmetsp:Transcript_25314/g.52599  ORF Transcript_25314/g.52599 Transcript_25314/m.52599 type:complete len:256 (-) Transcript_25314:1329-2096(-)